MPKFGSLLTRWTFLPLRCHPSWCNIEILDIGSGRSTRTSRFHRDSCYFRQFSELVSTLADTALCRADASGSLAWADDIRASVKEMQARWKLSTGEDSEPPNDHFRGQRRRSPSWAEFRRMVDAWRRMNGGEDIAVNDPSTIRPRTNPARVRQTASGTGQTEGFEDAEHAGEADPYS